MSGGLRGLRVAVVAPIMVRYDAISLSARDTVRALGTDPLFEAQHIGCACDFPEIRHRPCGTVADLLLDPFYQTADAAIFHFGIHHSLFDALMTGGPPVRIVRFHNVTPARFVGAATVPVIEKSLRQIEILRHADEIWADSPTNAQELIDRGFDPSRLRVIPLVVDDPGVARLAEKPVVPAHVLYVGRIAPSKGVHDLVLAVAKARLSKDALRVTIAGNVAWSDPSYLAQLHRLVGQYDLANVVHFAGTVNNAERDQLFHSAHILAIPSYHEGFCRPVAEGLRAGCIPLTYNAYNLPHIVAGLGRVVPSGNIDALTAALEDLVRTLPAALEHPTEPLLTLDRGKMSVATFTDLAHRHTASFAFEVVSTEIRNRLLQLTRHPVSMFAKPGGSGARQTAEMLPLIRDYVDSGLMRDPAGLSVWDLGCGNGRFAAAFLEAGAERILASDLHIPREGTAEVLRDDPRISWLVGDCAVACSAWGQPVPADLVFMSLMTEHIGDPRAFFHALAAALSPGTEVLIHHDNYFQPVGHHDHGLLFLNERTWSIDPQGIACWKTSGRCAVSAEHRRKLLVDFPHLWSQMSETTCDPKSCSDCNYFRRSQPWAHLLYGDDFRRTFPESFFSDSLNRITPDQLKWLVQEAGFAILNKRRTWVTNEVPSNLECRFGRETLSTFTITIRAHRLDS